MSSFRKHVVNFSLRFIRIRDDYYSDKDAREMLKGVEQVPGFLAFGYEKILPYVFDVREDIVNPPIGTRYDVQGCLDAVPTERFGLNALEEIGFDALEATACATVLGLVKAGLIKDEN